MATGLRAVFGWEKWIAPIVGTRTDHVPCMLMNGLAMLIAHYLLPTTPQGAETRKHVGSFKSIQRSYAVQKYKR